MKMKFDVFLVNYTINCSLFKSILTTFGFVDSNFVSSTVGLGYGMVK